MSKSNRSRKRSQGGSRSNFVCRLLSSVVSKMYSTKSSKEENAYVYYKRKELSDSVGQDSEYFCDYGGTKCLLHTDAAGFCVECGKYLCDACLSRHSTSKTTRKHILLDTERMPKNAESVCKMFGEKPSFERSSSDEGFVFVCSDNFRNTSSEVQNMGDTSKPQTDVSRSAYCRFPGAEMFQDEFTYIRALSCKIATDENDCYITDIISVSTTDLILNDLGNQSLKLFDTKRNVVKQIVKMPTPLYGITSVCEDEIAILPAKQFEIQILSLSGGFSIVRRLEPAGQCSGITSYHGNLCVSYHDPLKFEILKPTGEIIKTIHPSPDVIEHCTTPRHIAVSADGSLIYVSDWKTRSVICIDFHGNLVAVCKANLDRPLDILASPFGTVYLCNRDKHVVCRMSGDLAETSVILGRQEGLEYPQAICFDADWQYMYVSGGDVSDKKGSVVKLFERKLFYL